VVIRHAILTSLLLTALSTNAFAASPACLTCHPPHHGEWGSCTGCHRGDGRSLRMEIAHRDLVPGNLARHRLPNDPAVARGTKWLEKAACRRCHTTGGTGNRLAGNLDRLSHRHPRALLASIREPVAFMPDFRFDEPTAADLVNAILAGAAKQRGNAAEPPLVVRFSKGDDLRENIFVKRCGGCHRMLTTRLGGVGRGDVGPNLSGLLTKFYPANYGRGEPWTRDRLEKWLANPRQSRPLARMQPVRLEKKEFRDLLEMFAVR